MNFYTETFGEQKVCQTSHMKITDAKNKNFLKVTYSNCCENYLSLLSSERVYVGLMYICACILVF